MSTTSSTGLPAFQITRTSKNNKQPSSSHNYTQTNMVVASTVTGPFSAIRTVIKDVIDVINFRKKAKLAPAQWLILAKHLTAKKDAKAKEDTDAQKDADIQKETTTQKDAVTKQATDAKTGAKSKRLDNVPELVTFTESARPDSWRKRTGQEAYPVGKYTPEHAEWLHVLYLVSGMPLKQSKVNLADKVKSPKWKEDDLLKLRFEMASMVALFFVTGHELMEKVQAWPSLKDLVFIVSGDLDDTAQQWQPRRLELDVCWEHGFGKSTPFTIASMSMENTAARHRIALEIGILHALMTGTATGIAASTTPAGIEAMKLELSKSLQAEKTSISAQSLLGYDASIRKMFNRCLTWTGSPIDDPDGLQSELEAKQHILEGLRFAWEFWL